MVFIYSGMVLLLSSDKEEINVMGLNNGCLNSGVVLISGWSKCWVLLYISKAVRKNVNCEGFLKPI